LALAQEQDRSIIVIKANNAVAQTIKVESWHADVQWIAYPGWRWVPTGYGSMKHTRGEQR
jgi:hypothetical protein